MHIPDGFLDLRTSLAGGALASAGVGYALHRARADLAPGRVPLLGLSAAFVFAAQMINFPVLGGTSGHLMGGVLAGALLGPAAAVVVMTAVLIVQAFLFSDGGVLALGANLFNMAVLAPVAGSWLYRGLQRGIGGMRGLVAGAAFAGWFSTVLAAASCAGQLAMSGRVPWSTVFPAMVNVHMVIGLGEGAITALVLLAIARARPELLAKAASWEEARAGRIMVWGGLAALGLAVFVAPFASPWPDGLERVAENLGFADHAVSKPAVPSPFPDYQVPGISSAVRATAWAGAIGTILVFALSWLLARMLVSRPPSMDREGAGDAAGSAPAGRHHDLGRCD
ncbi:MAG TPA: energy-coupling factor ABC transporter permease [Candidatus Paceibacterota bacterium]|nr:energy-coupling factor ABC transporter permease [Verrucomicrobiota bacterium]HOX02641.1 energy-coupling factor ABC transporter permease [Verrucomicrobiota bacterium]HRZ43658.1 energy-coupling factor ABC transporter permease [Candidatus Paceibacterota bacterium]HRZ91277.1 energy-coupling factor ABC transporter permease [Candidatus Paceibacterota bacterium]